MMMRPRLFFVLFCALMALTPAVVAQTPPTLQLLDPTGNVTVPSTQTSYPFRGTAADDDGDLQRVEYRVNSGPWRQADGLADWRFTASALLPGGNDIVIRAVDAGGADSGERLVTVTRRVERIPPELTIVTPDGTVLLPNAQSEIAVSGTARDPNDSLLRVEYNVNGLGWRTADGLADWRFTATGLVPSENVISVRALSTQDNRVLTSDEQRLTVIRLTETADLEVVIVTPDGARSLPAGRTSLAFAGTARDAGGSLARVEYRVNGGVWIRADGLENWSFTATGLQPGGNLVTVRALNRQFATSPERRVSVSVGVSDNDPTVTVTAPAAAETFVAGAADTVRFAGTAVDADGRIAAVEYRVNDQVWRAASGTADWTFEHGGWPETVNTVRIRARDERGNLGPGALRLVTIGTPGGGDKLLFGNDFE